jgi:hypothetical protein
VDQAAFSLDNAFYAAAICIPSATSQERHEINKKNQMVEVVKQKQLPFRLSSASFKPCRYSASHREESQASALD